VEETVSRRKCSWLRALHRNTTPAKSGVKVKMADVGSK
jgi:hypothetical protein